MATAPLEKAPSPQQPEKQLHPVVIQPAKMEALIASILEQVGDLPKEQASETPGEQFPIGTSGSAGAQQAAAKRISLREQAIANLPPAEQMQVKLAVHIQAEVRKLRRQARMTALSKPGAAHALNELYAKMHKLNKFLFDLFEASIDIIKRLFIRVFVDRQTIL